MLHGSAGPPCARRDGVPSHTQKHLYLVSCTWRHPSHASHQKTPKASPDHVAVTCHRPSPTTLHISTWIEVSTCEVLDLARARSLQTAKSHFGSSSGTVEASCQAILAWLKTFPQLSRVSDRPSHNWMTR